MRIALSGWSTIAVIQPPSERSVAAASTRSNAVRRGGSNCFAAAYAKAAIMARLEADLELTPASFRA
jgi:hypothetical protein